MQVEDYAAHGIFSALEKWMPLYCGFREKAYTRTTDKHVHTHAYTSPPQAGRDKKERRGFWKILSTELAAGEHNNS